MNCPKCQDLIRRRVCGMCADCWKAAQDRNKLDQASKPSNLNPLTPKGGEA